MTKASHQIKCLAYTEEERGKGEVRRKLERHGLVRKRGIRGRSEQSKGDKWRTHLNITHLFMLSFLYFPHSLPLNLSACGPSSSSCHYRRAPVNQAFLIQWHVGRGHVTYVKKREWGDLQGVLVCDQVCVCMCIWLNDLRAEHGCQRVWCGRDGEWWKLWWHMRPGTNSE